MKIDKRVGMMMRGKDLGCLRVSQSYKPKKEMKKKMKRKGKEEKIERRRINEGRGKTHPF